MDPFQTDNAATARTLMIHQLSEAILGESYARPERPEQVWEELLAAVRSAAKTIIYSDPGAVRQLSAEVVAARQVVEQARRIKAVFPQGGALDKAIDAYDQTTGP